MTTLKSINELLRHNGPLEAEILEACARLVASGWYVLGNEVAAFEAEFADYCGQPHAVGVANGTDALELALRAVGVAAGDRVAVAANAGGYGTIALNAVGAVPAFVDVDESTFGMDPDALEAVLRAGDVRAVIVTHLYGRLAAIEEITRLAAGHGVKLVEDCAQAHGAARGGRRAGAWGDAATFSFYPTKNLGALGDGGAVVTGDPEVALKVRQLRQYGWDRKYSSAVAHGRNSRLDELQAAVLRTKLPYLPDWTARRAAVAGRYAEKIDNPLVTLPAVSGADYVAHLYVIRVADRDSLAAHLRENGVPHDIHYPTPDHRQPMFGDAFADVTLPVTERLAAEVLTLPCFPELTDAEIDWVADTVNAWRP